MAERKAFLLRVDPALLEAMQRWANDDLRSLNAQLEFVIRQALAHAGRTPQAAKSPAESQSTAGPPAHPPDPTDDEST